MGSKVQPCGHSGKMDSAALLGHVCRRYDGNIRLKLLQEFYRVFFLNTVSASALTFLSKNNVHQHGRRVGAGAGGESAPTLKIAPTPVTKYNDYSRQANRHPIHIW